MTSSTLLPNSFQTILIDKLRAGYIVLDVRMCIQALSEGLERYGFEDLRVGDDASQKIDFLVGIDVSMQLDLPVVSSPSGLPISVSLIPSDDVLNVLIWDVSTEHQQQQLLQQKANEVQLLLEQKNALLLQLQTAQQELQLKNKELSEASRLQSAFLSGVSHEFRTPLTSVIGYTNLLKVDEQQSQYVSAIARSSRHLLSLVENLLDHGKYESNELVIFPKKVRLKDVFDDAQILLKPLAETKNIDLLMECDFAEGIHVYVDEVRLRQCLINLVGNAIKFTDVGSVEVKVVWHSDVLDVCIEDTGLGINKADLDKIFLSFWQAKDTGKAGTGLGLTITKRMLELMGGELLVKSVINQGTTMRFKLTAPLVGTVELTKQTDTVLSMFNNKPLRVLLAEDDQDIADLLILLLQEKNVHVDHVTNGALAVEVLRNQRFDLVLMDIHMPVMGGYRAVELIRKDHDSTPIIVTTASAIEADKIKAESIGCNGYLVKPVTIDDILSLAKQFI